MHLDMRPLCVSDLDHPRGPVGFGPRWVGERPALPESGPKRGQQGVF